MAIENLPELIDFFFLTTLSFILCIALTPLLTHFLYKYKIWKKIREEAITGERAKVFYSLHKHKKNTPTMGGILLWGIILLTTLLFNLSREWTYLPLFTLVACGILGLVDDYVNIKGFSKIKGLPAKIKMFWLFLFSSLGAWWFFSKLGWNTIYLPLIGNFEIGWLYIPLFILVIISTANAVNITDGLDGLAGGLLTISFSAFATIAFFREQFGLASFCGTVVGVCLAYTWFSIHPARFYMGDTGSLALGATLGVVAMLTNSALILPIIGFVFLAEALSSIIQIFSKKFFKKKIFLCAPIHHHFEAKGWPETKVTMRFWVIGIIFAIIGLILRLI